MAQEAVAAPEQVVSPAKSVNPDAIATDEEVQAALAEAEAEDSALPSLDDGSPPEPPIVPVVVNQPQGAASNSAAPAGGEGGKKLSFKINAKPGAESKPAADATAAPAKPAASAPAAKSGAKTASAPTPAAHTPTLAEVKQKTIASRESLKGVGGAVYRAADATLTVVHVPFGWISGRARVVLGGVAIATAIVSMLSGWLIPSMFAKVDLTTHAHERRQAAEAALAARLEAAKAAAAGEKDAGDGHGGESHGGEDAHGGGHGGGEKAGAKEAKPAGGHDGAAKEAKPAGGHGH